MLGLYVFTKDQMISVMDWFDLYCTLGREPLFVYVHTGTTIFLEVRNVERQNVK
jgi:hypothetical protein